MTAAELAPRWERVMETRARLQAAGTWDSVVAESDKARAFQLARVRGEVTESVIALAVTTQGTVAGILTAVLDFWLGKFGYTSASTDVLHVSTFWCVPECFSGNHFKVS